MPSLKSCKIRVGITIGDPSGIGPIITLKALKELKGLADFTVIGDKWVLGKITNYQLPITDYEIIDLKNVARKIFSFGKIRKAYGRASLEYLDKTLELLKNNEIDCLVTCPVSKEAVNKFAPDFRGHTEYLAERTHSDEVAMLLLNKKLKIALVTRHLPLEKVAPALTKEKIKQTISLTRVALIKLFAITSPRLVVLGLNPHASDHGLLGNEEERVIKPALRELRPRIKNLAGPLSADAALLEAAAGKYDAVIAMYHDQALIPLKLTGKESGVNLTLGLPFVRTSALHGTAFDIAQRPEKASPASLIAAIKLAVRCTATLKKA